MKRLFLLLLLPLLLLTACATEETNYQTPVNFYYIHNDVEFGTDSGVIKATVREGAGHREDYFYLISQYLNGPISYDCISPFPAGTTLEELYWDQNRVQIVLSPHITTLSGIDLTIACACLVRTVADIVGVDTVQIRSSSGLLNGEHVLILSSGSFEYLDHLTPSDTFD